MSKKKLKKKSAKKKPDFGIEIQALREWCIKLQGEIIALRKRVELGP